MMRLFIFLLFATPCGDLGASDWAQLLGPTRDGVYAGPPRLLLKEY